ncbi:hypothetical protein Tco_1065873 [Tanacetum coccineum]
MELRNNTYHGRIDKDVIDHIAKVLKILDLINIHRADTHRLRMKVFPLSLADDARQWWINEGKGIITTWEELVDKFFCKFYPNSYDGEDEMLDDGDNWGIDPLKFISRVDSSFKTHGTVDGRTKKNNIEDEQCLTKRKRCNSILENDILNNTPDSTNEQPNKKVCKTKKFEAIKYSLGPNKEYIAVRRCEYNAWERNADCILELKRRNMKITDSDIPIRRIHQGRYGVSVPTLH